MAINDSEQDAADTRSPEFTYDQLHRLVFAAIDAGDWEAVERAMTYMAVYYPDEAKLIVETVAAVHDLRKRA